MSPLIGRNLMRNYMYSRPYIHEEKYIFKRNQNELIDFKGPEIYTVIKYKMRSLTRKDQKINNALS